MTIQDHLDEFKKQFPKKLIFEGFGSLKNIDTSKNEAIEEFLKAALTQVKEEQKEKDAKKAVLVRKKNFLFDDVAQRNIVIMVSQTIEEEIRNQSL